MDRSAHQAPSAEPGTRGRSHASTSDDVRGVVRWSRSGRHQGVRLRDRQAAPEESGVGEPGVPQRRPQGRPQHGVVRGVHDVERHAQERGLDEGAGREGGVDVGRVQVLEPVPECEVRRRRVLPLQCQQVPDGRGHAERLPVQQVLAGQGRAVELGRGRDHPRDPAVPALPGAPRWSRAVGARGPGNRAAPPGRRRTHEVADRARQPSPARRERRGAEDELEVRRGEVLRAVAARRTRARRRRAARRTSHGRRVRGRAPARDADAGAGRTRPPGRAPRPSSRR